MSSTDPILEIMRWILATSPLLLVYVLGIVVAVKRYRRHPRISTLALFALVGLLLLSVILPFMYRFVSDNFSALQVAGMDLFSFMLLLSFIHSMVHAALFVILLFAVFSGRSQHLGIRGADGQYLPPDFLTGHAQK